MGAGLYFFKFNPQEVVEVVEVEEEQGEFSLDEEHIYLELKPITATIFRNDKIAGNFTAAVTLQISRESVRTEIVEKRRRLRDAMFRELHAMFEREEYTGRKVDVDAVKQRMLLVVRKELGDDIVVDLFVRTLLRKGA
jgi:hypothetical protein